MANSSYAGAPFSTAGGAQPKASSAGPNSALSSRVAYRLILASFWIIAAASVALIATSLVTFKYVVQTKDALVAGLSDDVLQLEKLSLLAEQKIARSGAYLLTGKPAYLTTTRKLDKAFTAQLGRLRTQITDDKGSALLDEITRAEMAHQNAFNGIAPYISGNLERRGASVVWDQQVRPAHDRMEAAFTAAIAHEQAQLDSGIVAARQAESRGTRLLLAGAITTLILSLIFGSLGLRATHRLQKAEARVRENEAYFRELTDHTPSMVWVADQHGFVSYMNRTWLAFTGKPLKEELGFGWLNNLHPEDAQDTYDAFLSANRLKGPFKMIFRLFGKDGQYHWMLSSGAARFDTQGNFLGHVGSVVEIEQQKRAEKRLEDALASRDEFISVASHQLRTPLTSLKLFLQMTKRANSRSEKGVPAFELAGFCDSSLKQVRALERLVEDLLDVSRLRSGHLAIVPERLWLADVIRESVNHIIEDSSLAGNFIELDIDEQIQGEWDRYRLGQIVTNLVSNAIRHAPGTPIVISSKLVDGEKVELSIRDQGPGVPSEKLANIFERSERAPLQAGNRGLGLGLFITRGLVLAHHGDIHVDASCHKGARFVVELPLRFIEEEGSGNGVFSHHREVHFGQTIAHC
jgi:PAS domain S-box-containing protein